MAWRKEKQRLLDGLDLPEARLRDLYSTRYMFHVYRRKLTYQLGPFFVLFTLVDFYYKPDDAWLWLALRLVVPLYIWATLRLMANYRALRRHLNVVVLSVMGLVSIIVSVMVYQTGGAHSPYLPGPLVASAAVIILFNLRKRFAIYSQLIACVPVSIAMFLATGSSDVRATVTATIFYFALTFISIVGSSSREQLNQVWRRAQKQTALELAQHRRSDILKSHFPPLLRRAIEAGQLKLDERKIMKGAVVGFADIVGSTTIGNTVDLETDWHLKEAFLSSANLRARECNMVVLNQVGDGFVFLANFQDAASWEDNLLNFYERVTIDFQQTLMALHKQIGVVDSGIRFGVARGDVMMGWIGNASQSYFTAMGREVNLAARLCAVAAPNEMIISSMDSCLVESAVRKNKIERRVFVDLKGFPDEIHAIAVQPRAFSVLAEDPETEALIELALQDARSTRDRTVS